MQIYCPESSGRGRRARGAAFSLIELLMAAVIGVILFAALFRGLSDGYHLIQLERENMRATQILLGKMEAIRLCAWGSTITPNNQLFDPNIVPSSFSDYFYPVGLNSTTNLGTPYSGTITVLGTNVNWSGTTPSYSNNMAVVTVTVSWTNYFNGRPRAYTRSMRTYVARFGIQNYIYTH